MKEQVIKAIEEVRPMLKRDGGDIEFVALEGKVVKVRLKGACSGCPMSQMTVKSVVEKNIMAKVPGIERVDTVK
ncbi:MAG: NifU family protein [Candidatus Omnitrophica bacterium]|nr:NifU family protein [Candidatus Omnitrophota bacterium]